MTYHYQENEEDHEMGDLIEEEARQEVERRIAELMKERAPHQLTLTDRLVLGKLREAQEEIRNDNSGEHTT